MLDDEYEYIKIWFEHLYIWIGILETAKYVGYNSANIEQMRTRTYAALLMLADGVYATASEVSEVANLGTGDMDSVLVGLTFLREVEAELFDDGVMGYRLTTLGKRWASAIVAECE